jgi:hypothetical protein
MWRYGGVVVWVGQVHVSPEGECLLAHDDEAIITILKVPNDGLPYDKFLHP